MCKKWTSLPLTNRLVFERHVNWGWRFGSAFKIISTSASSELVVINHFTTICFESYTQLCVCVCSSSNADASSHLFVSLTNLKYTVSKVLCTCICMRLSTHEPHAGDRSSWPCESRSRNSNSGAVQYSSKCTQPQWITGAAELVSR